MPWASRRARAKTPSWGGGGKDRWCVEPWQEDAAAAPAPATGTAPGVRGVRKIRSSPVCALPVLWGEAGLAPRPVLPEPRLLDLQFRAGGAVAPRRGARRSLVLADVAEGDPLGAPGDPPEVHGGPHRSLREAPCRPRERGPPPAPPRSGRQGQGGGGGQGQGDGGQCGRQGGRRARRGPRGLKGSRPLGAAACLSGAEGPSRDLGFSAGAAAPLQISSYSGRQKSDSVTLLRGPLRACSKSPPVAFLP